MGLHRLPAGLRLGVYGLAVAILLYLCLAPSRDLPSVSIWDKAEHAVAWAVLAGLGLALFPRRAARIVVFALALGGLVEVLQGLLPLGRDAEWTDWLADSLGVAVALGAYALVPRARVDGSARLP